VATVVPDDARELYAISPDEFVAARNALAKRLKADGDEATAAAVSKLRRPTVAAAAVNLAVRDHRDLVDQLLDAGARLAAAQRQLLSGRDAADDLRKGGEERRRLVRELTDAVIVVAAREGRDVEHLRSEIAGTLEAATIDDELGERLRQGTVEKAVAPSAGLGGVEGFAVIPGGGGEPELQESTDVRRGRPGTDRAQQAAKEAKEARAAAERAAKAAEKAASQADRLAQAAAEAERAAREARAEERRLRDEAATARRRAERAERSAKAAAGRSKR
jgi:hypothetical protein